MKYTLEIQKILFQADDNKNLSPKDKIRLLKQAVAIADDNDDIEWGYDVRMQLIRECYYVASATDLINEFSWILNAHGNHPDWFDENDFLWQYKWILVRMYNNSQVSMEQINAVMEDFKTRLRRNGYGLRPYYDRLYDETLIIGDLEKAKEYLDLRNEAPDDAMGSCQACTLDYELDYYLAIGDFDEAYNRATPLLTKQISCTHVPARTFCALTYHAGKKGKTALAAELFERAEEEMGILFDLNDENLVAPVALLISYLFGVNEEKAWYYVEKTLPWYMESDDYARYKYAACLTEGLDKLNADKTATLELPTEFELYNAGHTYHTAELKDYFRKTAGQLAEAFDKRNNCHTFRDRLRS
jgi:hypothetical protein